jgi:hypothetical protein
MANSNELTRLVYVSNNTISETVFDQEIKAILNTAKENNSKSDITGSLLFNAGDFAQVLEGPMGAVEELFERIQNDDRHTNCMVLCCEPTTTRTFTNWSMAYEGADTAAKTQFSYLLQDSELCKELLSSDKILKIIVDHISQASTSSLGHIK